MQKKKMIISGLLVSCGESIKNLSQLNSYHLLFLNYFVVVKCIIINNQIVKKLLNK